MAQPHPEPLRKSIYFGTFIHNVSLSEVEILENSAVGVDEKGVIVFVEKDVGRSDVLRVAENHGWRTGWGLYLTSSGSRARFWFPGFIGEFGMVFLLGC